MSSCIVLKFGSSVLRTAADLPVAVHEIYGELREHRQVIAAVSAFEGETDRLFAEAAQQGLTDPYAIAAHVAKGEQETAAQLVRALDEAGVPARVADPRDFGFHAQGEPLDAVPYELNTIALRENLRVAPVVIVPGFYASDAQGRIVLLGRGGTDLTALYLAQQLGAFCRLVKDVDGIYESDPARARTLPPRFAHVSWEHAIEVGGKLVQPRAIRFAQQHRQRFAVGAAGNVQTTAVGPGPDTFKALRHDIPPLKVVLLGLGTVGLGVYRYLTLRPDLFDVRRIVVRDVNKPRDFAVPAGLLSTDIRAAVDEPADLIVEAIGGIDTVAEALLGALALGRSVVTANKALIAARWEKLTPYISGVRRQLHFSASVGGGVPVLETIDALTRNGGRIELVRAVINGTCNFILDEMARGNALSAAVEDAQARGFAEADPHSDLSGEDAAYKLGVIAATAFGAELALDRIERGGIENLKPTDLTAVRLRNCSLRLVATAQRQDGQWKLSVAPTEVANDDFLAGARNEENRIELRLSDGGCVRLSGKGAGRW